MYKIAYVKVVAMPHAVHICVYSSLSLSYDEEQAQNENTDRDLRSRSGQSLGTKSTKSGSTRPVTATWKWDQNLHHKADFYFLYIKQKYGNMKALIRIYLYIPAWC